MRNMLNGAKHVGRLTLRYVDLSQFQRASIIDDFFQRFSGRNSIDCNGKNCLTCTFCIEGPIPWYMETYLHKWNEHSTYISFVPYGDTEYTFKVEPGYMVISRSIENAEISGVLYYFFNHYGKKNAIKIKGGKLLLKMKLYDGFRGQDEVLKISDCDIVCYEGVDDDGSSMKTIELFEIIPKEIYQQNSPEKTDKPEETAYLNGSDKTGELAKNDENNEFEGPAVPSDNAESEELTVSNENDESEEPAVLSDNAESEELIVPNGNDGTKEMAAIDNNAESEELTVPNENDESEEPAVPDDNAESEELTVPDENDESEEPAVPDENAESEEPSKPENAEKSEDSRSTSDRESVLETNLQSLAEKSRSYEEFVRNVCKWVGYKKEDAFVGISKLERSELDWPTMIRKVPECNTTDRNFLPTAIINKCKQIGMGKVRFKTFMLNMFKYKTFDFAGTQRAIAVFGNNKRIGWIQELADAIDASLKFESKVRKMMWNIGKETEAFSGDTRETIIRMIIDAITPEKINYSLFVCNPSFADSRNRAITVLDSMINEYNESKGGTERIEINEFLLNLKLAIENMC